jgi:hypothetical protein
MFVLISALMLHHLAMAALGDGRVYFAKNDIVLIINLKGKRHDDS